MPKDTDEFLVELDGLNKSFQKHVRNERKELLPAVLKVLSDEEAAALATGIEGAVADAEKAKRDEKRDDIAQTRRETEKAEEAATAERAATRTVRAAERTTREAAEKTVDTMSRGMSVVQDNAGQLTRSIDEQTQKLVSKAREAISAYSNSSQSMRDDMQAVRASSSISVGAASEVYAAWMEWVGHTARSNVDAARQLVQCKSLTQVMALQSELATGGLRTWMESNAKMLQITQRASKQAQAPLDGRLSEAT